MNKATTKRKFKERKKLATEYELLSRDVLENLFLRNREDAVVEHDMPLPSRAIDRKGKPLMRQADVYAKFPQSGKKSLVVQAKHWTSPIRLPIVDSLVGMMFSLKEPCEGMLITPTRYQRGALLLAQQLGLELCILRRTTPKDFKDGRIPEIDAEIVMMGYLSDKVQVFIPREQAQRFPSELKELSSLQPEEVQLYSSSGDLIGTMVDLHKIVQSKFQSKLTYDEYAEFSIEPPVFLKLAGTLVELGAIRGQFSRRELYRQKIQNKVTHVFARLNTREVYLVDQKKELTIPGENITAQTGWIDMKKYFPHWFPDDD